MDWKRVSRLEKGVEFKVKKIEKGVATGLGCVLIRKGCCATGKGCLVLYVRKGCLPIRKGFLPIRMRFPLFALAIPFSGNACFGVRQRGNAAGCGSFKPSNLTLTQRQERDFRVDFLCFSGGNGRIGNIITTVQFSVTTRMVHDKSTRWVAKQ